MRGVALCLWLAVASSAAGCSHSSSGVAAPQSEAQVGAASAPGPDGRLPDDVEPVSYRLELEIVPSRTTFSGHAHIELEVRRPVSAIYLHAKELALSHVMVSTDGATPRAAEPQVLGEGGLVRLQLGEALPVGHAAVDIDYQASFDQRLRGLYRVESAGHPYVFSQFEAISARQAFPCFDEPRYKTSFQISVRVPSDATAVSNTSMAATRPLADGLRQVDFAPTAPLPTYLVALAVGPFDVVAAPPGALENGVPLRGVSALGRGADLAFILSETPSLLAALEDYTGIRYPYEKLDLIAVPDFAYGAMENAGAITFRDSLLLLGRDAPEGQRRSAIGVTAHELSHMWFGDLVTMPWWDDVWLNEAFATWITRRVVAELHPEFHMDFNRVLDVDGAMRLDSLASARQIRQPILSEHDIENAFDGITYVKGGAVLDTFESYLGPERFREGIRNYLNAHRFGSATARDLLSALDAAAQVPVAAAFSTFLDQPGLPRVSAELRCDGSGPPRLRLAQSRYLPLGSKAKTDQSWQIPVCVRYGRAAQDAGPSGERSSKLCSLLSEAELELPLPASACPSFVLPNADARGYYLWSLGERDLDALLEHLGELGVAERLSSLFNADAAARSGELSIERLLQLALEVGKGEEQASVQAALGVIESLRDPLLDDAALPGYRSLVVGLVQRRAHALGLFPRRGSEESGETKLLRPLLFGALALEGRDPGALKELARLGRARLGLGQDARLADLPSELHELALAAAVMTDGAPALARASRALADSNDGLERRRLLRALGANQEPGLTPTLLELVLTPGALRTNEVLSLLFMQMERRETRAAAYRWLVEHILAVVERVGKDNAGDLPELASSFCTATEAAAARAFFEPRVQAWTGGPHNLQQSLEAIDLCLAFAARHASSARSYFTGLKGK